MRILITRPSERVMSLSHRLHALGHHTIIDPLIQILPIPRNLLVFPSPFSFEAIVTTSQQAIYHLATLTPERGFPLWCVGDESKKTAKSLGFQVIHTAEGNAGSLISHLLKAFPSPSPKPILHVSGDVVRVNITDALQARGIAAQHLIIYQTKEAQTLSQETQETLRTGSLDAILFYSPRTAAIFQHLCQGAGLARYCASLAAFCLSEAVKAEILGLPWKAIHVAKKTSTDDLLMLLMGIDP